jgi:hypothetical protein
MRLSSIWTKLLIQQSMGTGRMNDRWKWGRTRGGNWSNTLLYYMGQGGKQ